METVSRMTERQIARYVGAYCEFELKNDQRLKGVILKGEEPNRLDEFYLVRASDLLDYKVAHLQNDELTMNKLHRKIDLQSIANVRLSNDTSDLL